MAACATVFYLVIALTFFYIDVILYEMRWAVPIYAACFLLVPAAVYYVVYRIVRLQV